MFSKKKEQIDIEIPDVEELNKDLDKLLEKQTTFAQADNIVDNSHVNKNQEPDFIPVLEGVQNDAPVRLEIRLTDIQLKARRLLIILQNNLNNVLMEQEDATLMLVCALVSGKPFALSGSRVSGKTTLMKAVACCFGIELVSIDLCSFEKNIFSKLNDIVVEITNIEHASAESIETCLRFLKTNDNIKNRLIVALSYSSELSYKLPIEVADMLVAKVMLQDLTSDAMSKIINKIILPANYNTSWMELNHIKQVSRTKELSILHKVVNELFIEPSVVNRVMTLVSNIKSHTYFLNKPTLNASLSIISLARAYALIQEQSQVKHEHVNAVLTSGLLHRLNPSVACEMHGGDILDILQKLKNL